jgi:putative membrane protein
LVKPLTHNELAKLHAAEQAASARIGARLAVVVTPISDRYALYPIVYGAAASVAVLALLALFVPDLSLRDGFFATAIAFGAVSLLLELPPLKLALVPKKIKHHHARDMAHKAFAARILSQADKKPGLLLFASLGERYLEVIADRDVHRHVPQAEWDGLVAELAETARKGRIADGLAYAVGDCAKILEKHYPPKLSGSELVY